MTVSSVTTTPGEPGERWGDFVFSHPDNPEHYGATPPPAGDVGPEEGIPDGHPGLRTFDSIDAARRGLGGAAVVPEPAFLPAGYNLIGVWAIQLDDGRVVDVNLSYSKGSNGFSLFGPELSVSWTDRAPRPLPASTVENHLPNGSVGSPVVKADVHGIPAVFQGWTNPASLVGSARTNSSLNWFEEGGRLWAVQGGEPFETLHAMAESIRTT